MVHFGFIFNFEVVSNAYVSTHVFIRHVYWHFGVVVRWFVSLVVDRVDSHEEIANRWFGVEETNWSFVEFDDE